MILVTGATGGLGHETIDCLLTTTPAAEIAALVRDASKATDLVQRGVAVRQADYFDYPALVQAFQGIEKVLLVSTVAFTDRVHQHRPASRGEAPLLHQHPAQHRFCAGRGHGE